MTKSQTPSLESFEETYKTAYSHGLEAIYSLENVDLKTVKKIEENAPQIDEAGEEGKIDWTGRLDGSQLCFDFGEDFRDWITPYFLREPVKVLGLSKQAEACLLEHGMERLSHLLENDFNKYELLKGIGQGHIDEIFSKLKSYVAGRSLEQTDTIDFGSFLATLSMGIDFQSFSYYLKDYGLEDVLPLTYAQKIELKAFRSRDDAMERVGDHLADRAIREEVQSNLRRIAKALIAPWILERGGVATVEEIIERIERVSTEPEKTGLYLRFFEENFASGGFLFDSYLFSAEEQVYCSDLRHRQVFAQIVAKAKTYFYSPSVYYGFEELKTYLAREFAKEWTDCSERMISESLKRSKAFLVFRGSSENLEIRLA